MTNSLNLREMALEILLEVEKNGAYPNVLLVGRQVRTELSCNQDLVQLLHGNPGLV